MFVLLCPSSYISLNRSVFFSPPPSPFSPSLPPSPLTDELQSELNTLGEQLKSSQNSVATMTKQVQQKEDEVADKKVGFLLFSSVLSSSFCFSSLVSLHLFIHVLISLPSLFLFPLQTEYETVQGELDRKKESLLATDKHISKLMSERDKLSKQSTDTDIELKKIEHKIQRHHQEKENAQRVVRHLEEKYTWINAEKQ